MKFTFCTALTVLTLENLIHALPRSSRPATNHSFLAQTNFSHVETTSARSTRPRLIRRHLPDDPAPDSLWAAAQCKGARLVQAMLASDEEAGMMIQDTRTPPSAASIWQGDLREELKTWGWTDFYTEDDEYLADQEHDWDVGEALHHLGANGEPWSMGGDNVPYHIEHWDQTKRDERGNLVSLRLQSYQVGGKSYRATGARHLFTVNYKAGLIFVQYITGPHHAVREWWNRDAGKDELPLLSKLSDVLWGYWNRNGNDINRIRAFWVENVANVDSNGIIARALKGAGKDLRTWPGVTFGMQSEAGQAILGSPNGATFAWFLIQHKAQLGAKSISKVTVFMNDLDDEFQDAHLLFFVDHAPAPRSASKSGLNAKEEVEAFEPLQAKRPDTLQLHDQPLRNETLSRLRLEVSARGLDRRFNPWDYTDEATWTKAQCMGEKFLAAMLGDDQKAGQIFEDSRSPPSMRSVWQGDLRADMQKWNWLELDALEESSCDFIGEYKTISSMRDLGLNGKPKLEGGDNSCFRLMHGNPGLQDENLVNIEYAKQKYYVDGRQYTATGGHYYGAVNTKGGVIFSQNVYSPAHMVLLTWGRPAQPDELPALRSNADIFWGMWIRDNPDVRNIKYFWVQWVINEQTNRLMATCLAATSSRMDNWPGVTFSIDSPQGQALLGSPNGIAFGYFLVSHKAELGQKWISKITVFIGGDNQDADFGGVDMLFWVEDVPPERLNQDPGPSSASLAHAENEVANFTQAHNSMDIVHERQVGRKMVERSVEIRARL